VADRSPSEEPRHGKGCVRIYLPEDVPDAPVVICSQLLWRHWASCVSPGFQACRKRSLSSSTFG